MNLQHRVHPADIADLSCQRVTSGIGRSAHRIGGARGATSGGFLQQLRMAGFALYQRFSTKFHDFQHVFGIQFVVVAQQDSLRVTVDVTHVLSAETQGFLEIPVSQSYVLVCFE